MVACSIGISLRCITCIWPSSNSNHSRYYSTGQSTKPSVFNIVRIELLSTMNSTSTHPLELKILFYSAFIISFPLIIIGNILVIAAIIINRCLRTATNALVFSLSLADFPVALLVFPLISVTQKYGPTMSSSIGLLLCHVSIFTTQIFLSSSCLHLLFISADRYIAITKPLRYKALVTNRRVGAVIAFIWVLSVFASVLPFFGWRRITDRTQGGFCQYHLNLDITYILFLHVFVCIIPLTVTCAAYIQIFIIARRQAIKIATTDINVSERQRQQRVLEKERKITRTVSVVVGVFILCWGPLNILLLVYAICNRCVSSLVVEGVEILALMNSACNPLIYSACNKDFRKAFKRLLCCQCRRVDGSHGVNFDNTDTHIRQSEMTKQH